MLALDAQRARLEAVVEQAPVGVVIADAATGRLLLGNAEVDRVYGRPFEPADGEDPGPPAFVPHGRPRARRPTRPPWRVRCAARSSRRRSWASSAPTRLRATLLAWAAPIRAADGTIGSAVVALDDIAERGSSRRTSRCLAEAGDLLSSSLATRSAPAAWRASPSHGRRTRHPSSWSTRCGRPRPARAAHVDPAKVELARRLRERYPPIRRPAVRVLP